MGSSTEEESAAYAKFEKKVKRTVLFDSLAPQVTAQTIKSALGQFGSVISVEFIPNYTIPEDIPQAALVEMENEKQAESLVTEMSNCPFMLSGMPRPVKVQRAKAIHFAFRPRRPGRKINFRWVKHGDPDFENSKRLKQLVKKHAKESVALLQHQLNMEKDLEGQQEDMLRTNYMKYEMIEKVIEEGSLRRLATCYNISLKDEGL